MLFNVVLTFHVIVCISLIAIVLVQRGRGAGLIESAAGAENLFGTKTAGFFVKATTVLAVLFFVLSIVLTILSKHRGTSVLEKMAVPGVPKAVAASKEETKVDAAKAVASAEKVVAEAKAVASSAAPVAAAPTAKK